MIIHPRQPRRLGAKNDSFSRFHMIMVVFAMVLVALPFRAESNDASTASAKPSDATADKPSDSAPPSTDADWYEVDDTTTGATDGQVLEVPQVINPADSNVANGDTGDADAAQAQAANGTDSNGNTASAPDEIG